MFPTKFGAVQRRRMACDVLPTLQNKSSAYVVGEGGVPRARTILGALRRRSGKGPADAA